MQVPGDGTLPPPFLLERLYLIKTVLLIRRLEELIRCWGYYVTRELSRSNLFPILQGSVFSYPPR